MADLDKLRALLVLLREFGVTKYSEPPTPATFTSTGQLRERASDGTIIELGPLPSALASLAKDAAARRAEDPALASLRRIQDALRPSALDEGADLG